MIADTVGAAPALVHHCSDTKEQAVEAATAAASAPVMDAPKAVEESPSTGSAPA
ncbi:hypothetical protein GCM10010145_67010 [Streptomyces ruber]|uniref:Uncharacterized protein n=2 Tax=Streptomyces TaxID=1883 RepID=A0A918BRC7_9ACTN|nr:hypothetical protein [Streptomyces ruber]GGQ88182.1 hypothetical protein GCM10010145_67010 [Streptomyces ruber]